MNYGMCIAMDCIGILLLVLMRFDFGAMSTRDRDFAGRMFQWMLRINIGLLMMDMLTWIAMDRRTPYAGTVHRTAMFLYYALQAPICYCWAIYCDYKLMEDLRRIRRRMAVLAVPMLVMTALLVVNLFTPVIYMITDENEYVRMPLYPISVVMCLPYYLYSLVITLKHFRSGRKWQSSNPARHLLLYPTFPLLFVILQSLFYGLAIVWMGSVISLLIIYFNLQNAKITTDALTGISNRHRFESYIRYKLRNRTEGTCLFVLMIDIDRFKSINDRCGHLMGDAAIRRTAEQIIKGARRSDFVARIGGDEFVVIGECIAPQTVSEIIQNIQTSMAETQADAFPISVSIGHSILAPSESKTIDELIAEADRTMYAQKRPSAVPAVPADNCCRI